MLALHIAYRCEPVLINLTNDGLKLYMKIDLDCTC